MTTHDKSPHQSINQPFTRRTLSFKENAMSLSRDSDNHRLVAHLPLRPWLYTLGLAWMSLAAFLGDPLA